MATYHANCLLVVALAACCIPKAAAAVSSEPLSLSQVRRWAYQINGLDAAGAVAALAASNYDVLVIEPMRTATDTADFNTAAMVAQLKASAASDGVHRKRVIAYMNVGQAEDWRWYWAWPETSDWAPGTARPASTPSWMVEPDPDGWKGNFVLQYWAPEWRDILITGDTHPATASRDYNSTLDAITKDGFDGVYMDWIAAATTDAVIAQAQAQDRDAVSEMAKLVADIRAYGKARTPDFVVIQQNAAVLVDGAFTGNASASAALVAVVDGIAQEDTWYGGGADAEWDSPQSYGVKTDPTDTSNTIANLKKWQAKGKTVFTVDYTVTQAPGIYNLSAALGFVPYCSRSGLSKLTTTPPPDTQVAAAGNASVSLVSPSPPVSPGSSPGTSPGPSTGSGAASAGRDGVVGVLAAAVLVLIFELVTM